MLPRILIVSCGGTISSRADHVGAPATPALSGAELVEAIPELAEVASLTAVVHSLVPSSFATVGAALDLYARIGELAMTAAASGRAYDGIVVTHGTDTLEEVAFLLDLFWRDDVPLVLTGAMRNASLPGADGPANLFSAIATAVSAQARGLGVLVVLNDEVHAARLVRKTHTSNVATFASPGFGPIGLVVEGRPIIVLAPRVRMTLDAPPSTVDAGAVALVRVVLGDDARTLAAASAEACAGLVIESMGGGHLPPTLAESEAFDAALKRMPVVLASRVGAGATLSRTYEFVGSETWLFRRGVIGSGLLDGLKARLLLAILIAQGAPRSELARVFSAVGHGSIDERGP